VVGLLGLDVSGGLGLGLSRGGGSLDFRIPGFLDLDWFCVVFLSRDASHSWGLFVYHFLFVNDHRRTLLRTGCLCVCVCVIV
jgi:hypothetical protein